MHIKTMFLAALLLFGSAVLSDSRADGYTLTIGAVSPTQWGTFCKDEADGEAIANIAHQSGMNAAGGVLEDFQRHGKCDVLDISSPVPMWVLSVKYSQPTSDGSKIIKVVAVSFGNEPDPNKLMYLVCSNPVIGSGIEEPAGDGI